MPTPAYTRTVIATNVTRRPIAPSTPGAGSAGSVSSRKLKDASPAAPIAKTSTAAPPLTHSRNAPQESQATVAAQVFPALLAEADQLVRLGQYPAASSMYSRALELCPHDPTALSARSRCYVLLGNADPALADAEAALKVDRTNPKALAAKADALFSRGDFEEALVWFHRGALSRPDVDEFRIGVLRATEAICSALSGIDPNRLRVQRANQEAIETGIGDVKSHQVTKKRTGLVHHPGAVGRNVSSHTLWKSNASLTGPNGNRPTTTTPRRPSVGVPTAPVPQQPREILERNLLEELYDDHVFLLALAADASLMDAADGDVGSLVQEGCRYMQSRLDYWQVRNPSGRPASATVSAVAKMRGLLGNKGPNAARKDTVGGTVGTRSFRPSAATPIRKVA
ncbi:Tetratricopeptide repeat protein 25 [Thoreauomyces humboldtii]|nr:Tetratricopeptide repeat protein 25 [Thoreauomyces humboldtii]